MRARTRQLGSFESVIWAYGYGVPKREYDLNVTVQQDDLSQLSMEELVERMKTILHDLAEAQELEEAIPAEYKTAADTPAERVDLTLVAPPDDSYEKERE